VSCATRFRTPTRSRPELNSAEVLGRLARGEDVDASEYMGISVPLISIPELDQLSERGLEPVQGGQLGIGQPEAGRRDAGGIVGVRIPPSISFAVEPRIARVEADDLALRSRSRP
jgi:hypothetical protein